MSSEIWRRNFKGIDILSREAILSKRFCSLLERNLLLKEGICYHMLVWVFPCSNVSEGVCVGNLGPVVQSIVSLTSSLMTNSLTVVVNVFSNTDIFAAKI